MLLDDEIYSLILMVAILK